MLLQIIAFNWNCVLRMVHNVHYAVIDKTNKGRTEIKE